MITEKFFKAIVKQALLFLGKKLDKIAEGKDQKISIDLGDATSTFKQAAERMNDVLDTIDAAEAARGNKASKEAENFRDLVVAMRDNAKALAEISDKEFSLDFPEDLKETLVLMAGEMKNLKPEKAEKIDLSKLEKTMGLVLSELKRDRNGDLRSLLKQLLDKKQKDFPTTIKLDDMQVRAMASRGGGVGGPSTNGAIKSGRKVVVSEGTPIAIGDDRCEDVWVSALPTNTDLIVFGDRNIDYTEATRRGAPLMPGEKAVIKIHNLKEIYIDGVTGEGVSFTYTQ